MTSTRTASGPEVQRLDFAVSDERTGFRLRRLEVYNWGTFDGRVWQVRADGRNALLTGEVGSGKSTLVDALTTLLVPPQKLSYNRAAGADARERTARSYVFGHYKAERGEGAASVRPVALRDANQYAVLLAQFENEGYAEVVTLATVFWLSSAEGQPERMYVMADRALSIAEHFADFGTQISALRKRLRKLTKEVHDAFPPYAAAFRRRFGLANDQALELFHQTVSMKTVGNLTDFVRQHMLQPFPVEERIAALVRHVDDLVRAHDAVLRAKAQIARLEPLVADCDQLSMLRAEMDQVTRAREALSAWFAQAKVGMLEERAARIEAELARLAARLDDLAERRRRLEGQAEDLVREIAANGGERLEQLRREIETLSQERDDRKRRAAQYETLARDAELEPPNDADRFLSNQRSLAVAREETDTALARAQNDLTELEVAFRKQRDERDAVGAELESLRRRRSNIPSRQVNLRTQLCRALDLPEDALPFAGELVQVREDEGAWEGAAERLLRGFGTSLLVSEAHYTAVAEWVDRTHLGDRLVYYRVRPVRSLRTANTGPDSLVCKLEVKPDAEHYAWLTAELARRFDYACCKDLAQFRREQQAVTRSGQVKGANEKHEKDDRFAVGDRSRFVLGWSNDAKIAVLEEERRVLERRIAKLGCELTSAGDRADALKARLDALGKLALFERFRDLDWRASVLAIEEREEERRRLEATSDWLRVLRARLEEVQGEHRKTAESERTAQTARGKEEGRLDGTRASLRASEETLASVPEAERAQVLPTLDAMRGEALADRALTIESADAREREYREFLQARLDAEEKRAKRLTERIVQAMQAYRTDYPIDAREADASVDAAEEYRRMLTALVSDDLPRFERRFKELLNENTIREIASFHAQLQRERQETRERIDEINRSLKTIDYSPGRYIELEAAASPDPEVRDFQGDLRACIEGAFSGSEDAAYSEARFIQVKAIIDRFRGREGSAEVDRRWTRKVTDVRNWSVFSASERWREDDREHEHYSDSGGKSGGQKEKLAYTVLAASLAYQFGLKAGEHRSRSFRFVAIDEAFARGDDDAATFALELFHRLNLQLLVVTPLQKIHVIEPFVSSVAFVHIEEGKRSMIRNLTIEEYRAERAARAG
ncbi:MAG TPA: SbcC/MukB-like Walker B domain-containing protein [Anaeromyxobacteraceae bacterium]|nr:SbcC/MukB-like Walker B domain-containing protein [Anaeromyxobacteraceae bacterium]